MTKIFYFLLFILFALVSCKVGYMKLTNTRQPYSGREIKTKGYYYCIDTVYSESLSKPSKQVLARIYFFYRNGVLHYSNTEFSNFENLEKLFIDTTYMLRYKERPYGWGIYFVERDRVKVETWAPSTGGKHPNFTHNLDILNDTSIHDSYGNNTYYYKNFTPKPDSLNRFIE